MPDGTDLTVKRDNITSDAVPGVFFNQPTYMWQPSFHLFWKDPSARKNGEDSLTLDSITLDVCVQFNTPLDLNSDFTLSLKKGSIRVNDDPKIINIIIVDAKKVQSWSLLQTLLIYIFDDSKELVCSNGPHKTCKPIFKMSNKITVLIIHKQIRN